MYKTNNNPSGLYHLKQSLDCGKLNYHDNMNYAFLKDPYIFKIPICLKHLLQLYQIILKKPCTGINHLCSDEIPSHFLCEVALSGGGGWGGGKEEKCVF